MKKVIIVLLLCYLSLCLTAEFAFAEDAVTEDNQITITYNPDESNTYTISDDIPVVKLDSVQSMAVTPSAITVPLQESTTQFDATIGATMINVTIPLNVDVYIDPNKEDGFMYGSIEIDNKTNAPVVVSIKDFHTETIPFRECIAPQELPSYYDWDNMSVTETEQYFALGIKPITYNGRQWAEEHVIDYVYATKDFKQTSLGVISGKNKAYLGLRSYYGKAFEEGKHFSFSATFVVELKD